jgi:hypothetical protein
MADRLGNLEEAEQLVIGLLEQAGAALSELKEIQANDRDKEQGFLVHAADYLKNLVTIRAIILQSLDSLQEQRPPAVRHPGIEQLALAQWETKVVADNLHDILQ